eukprot:5861465-Pyramimonas_sp.AAC.1
MEEEEEKEAEEEEEEDQGKPTRAPREPQEGPLRALLGLSWGSPGSSRGLPGVIDLGSRRSKEGSHI